MSPDEIKKLRDDLGCSLGELATFVGVDVKTVIEWEAGDLFPTKRHVVNLEAARKAGPEAIRRPKAVAAPNGLDALSDPRLWAIVQKLVTDPTFFAEVEKLAARPQFD
ncbi:MAG TPA: XRE family transcriptional regulator [Polyangiaceae bacterium]|jgi:transcriptional regulator with XRE-family HTH domain|nr:XRE family transcriptional regulator [Polyangiaceae bacterium]